MAINDLCNKPFGPGGGTRRLHQNKRGRYRIDEGVKIEFSLGRYHRYRIKTIVANDNYAEARLAA